MKQQRLNSFRTTVIVVGLLALATARSLPAQAPAPAPAAGAPAPVPEKKKTWETVANAGVTLTRGNSRNLLASAGIKSQRKWSKDEVFLDAAAAYGNTTARDTGDKTTTDHYLKGFSQYNHLFTERLYGGLRVDGVYDKISGINYRFTMSPMLGYYFIKATNTFLSAELGPSIITEETRGPRVPVGPPAGPHRKDETTYPAARVGERFEHKFKTGARIWETAEWIPQISDFDNWLLNVEVGVSAPITKKLDVRLVLQDSYDNVPPQGREKNDLKLIAGLGYKF